MNTTHLNTGQENEAMRSPESFRPDLHIDNGRRETHERINAIVRTSPPSSDEHGDGKKKPPPNKGTDSYEEKIIRKNNAEDAKNLIPAKNQPFRFARNTLVASALGLTALGSQGTSYISQLPLIGKIPYLPQVGAAMYSGLSSLVTPLGLGTGANATNWLMASAPNFVGPTAAVTLGITTGLFALGLAKSWIKGESYKTLGNNIAEATKLLAEIPFMPYHFLMNARETTGRVAGGMWKGIMDPIKAGWKQTKKVATDTWHGTYNAAGAALKPSALGVGGALLGAAITGGAGAGLIPVALAGYASANYLKHTGALKGGGSQHGGH